MVEMTAIKDDHLAQTLLSFRASPLATECYQQQESKTNNNISAVQAYAKLQGDNWHSYIQKLSIVLGRSLSEENVNESTPDVQLGFSKSISRAHAKIDFNNANRQWEFTCLGRNGSKVNGKSVSIGDGAIPLRSQSLIDIAGVSFYFLLPVSQDDSANDSPADDSTISPQSNSPISSECTASETSITGNASKNDDPGFLVKPSSSYATLIAEAINSVPAKRMTLSGIYAYISEKYTYYKQTKNGWQNSIRHNLSLNKAFVKVPRSATEPGKGMFWIIDPNYAHLFESGAKRRGKIRKMPERVTPLRSKEDFCAIPDSTILFKSLPLHYFELKNIDQVPNTSVPLPSLSSVIDEPEKSSSFWPMRLSEASSLVANKPPSLPETSSTSTRVCSPEFSALENKKNEAEYSH